MPSVRASVAQLGGVASMGVDGTLAIRKGFPFGEFVQQCWFIAKVTAVPVVLISIPFGVIIALHVGRSPSSSARSRPSAPRWSSPSCASPHRSRPRC